MQVMLMRLMSKGEYVIVPKGTKFTGSGKLGLRTVGFSRFSYCLHLYYNLFLQIPNTDIFENNVLLCHASHTIVSHESHFLQATTHNTEG